jgi:hypothetical protein
VDYSRLRSDALSVLDEYVAQFAKPWPPGLTESERKAAMINAYNALTIRWVLDNYPVDSIQSTAEPFKKARHRLNGEWVSLDDIETQLRSLKDPRIHSALVCAAISCPPLRPEAYDPAILEAQLDDNTKAWLANEKLNNFNAETRTATVSSIFQWYRDDFESSGRSLGDFLAQYGGPNARFLADGGQVQIDFKNYDWGLNDSHGGDLGGRQTKRAQPPDRRLRRSDLPASKGEKLR